MRSHQMWSMWLCVCMCVVMCVAMYMCVCVQDLNAVPSKKRNDVRRHRTRGAHEDFGADARTVEGGGVVRAVVNMRSRPGMYM